MNSDIFRTHDQEKAVQAICKVATGHRRRPLLLLSDRGRGKTSSLGIAAAQLLANGIEKIIVTAPRLGAVDTLFERAQAILSVSSSKQGYLSAGSAELMFVPPDKLLQELPDADLVMVDEAAAIPIPMLERILRRYARIVFSSTVHGYEGTGRGFTLRFGETLEQLTPSRKVLTMREPIRWAENDPLEKFIFQSLLLDASIPAADEIHKWSIDNLILEKLDHEQLHDEDTLRSVFGMLVMAHYQTRPMDLRRILDAPDLDIFVARLGGNPVGVVLCVREGGLPSEFTNEIFEGRRRLQGHLIPQSLVTHSGILEAMDIRMARIMRIAVHPVLQRKGIGKKLVNFACKYYRDEHLDALGVSFGATIDVVRFWRSCGFDLCRIGFKREASSGTHSFIMLRAISDIGSKLQALSATRCIDELPHQLSEALRDLDARLLYEALPSQEASPHAGLDSEDERVLTAFSSGNRGYEESIAAIWKLMTIALSRPDLLEQLDFNDWVVLCNRVLQKHDWADVVKNLNLKGKTELVNRMRGGVAIILKKLQHDG